MTHHELIKRFGPKGLQIIKTANGWAGKIGDSEWFDLGLAIDATEDQARASILLAMFNA